MLIEIVLKLKERSPLKYDLVCNMDCFNPNMMVREGGVAARHFKRVTL